MTKPGPAQRLLAIIRTISMGEDPVEKGVAASLLLDIGADPVELQRFQSGLQASNEALSLAKNLRVVAASGAVRAQREIDGLCNGFPGLVISMTWLPQNFGRI